MKRFLSVLMLLSVLCGMVLPAAAAEDSCAGGCILPSLHHETGSACITGLPIDDPSSLSNLAALKDAWWAFVQAHIPSEAYDRNPDEAFLDRADRNLTVILPAGSLEGFDCDVSLGGKKYLTIKGASQGHTQMTGRIRLGSDSDCIRLEDLSFDASRHPEGNICLENSQGSYIIDSCEFLEYEGKNLPAIIVSHAGGSAPKVTIENNTCTTSIPEENRISYGLPIKINENITVFVYAKSNKITLGLEASVSAGDDSIRLDPGDTVKIPSGGSLVYQVSGGIPKKGNYYVVDPNGKWLGTAVHQDSSVLIPVDSKGYYSIILDKAPQLVINGDTAELTLTEEHLKHIKDGIEIPSPYTGATVTFQDVKISSSVKDEVLSFDPEGNYGTYVIKRTDAAKTVTKRTAVVPQNFYLVTPAAFTSAMRSIKDGNITINCDPAGRKPISLPVSSIATTAENGLSLTLVTGQYALKLDAAALKALAQQAKSDTVLLQYRSLNHKTLSKEALRAVDRHLSQHPGHVQDLAFAVTATSDSEAIVDLLRGTITLTVPFIVLPGTEDISNESYALLDDGTSEARPTIVEDSYLTTVISELTEHMVFQVTEEEPPVTQEPTVEATEETFPETTEETIPETTAQEEEGSRPGSALIPLLIASYAGLLGICAVVFLILRKVKK